ncbi:MAG: hypothetical protein R8G66_05460 [Cytophagales bacterium]|nr:hypothetical protein [Cytophagales bacterium]
MNHQEIEALIKGFEDGTWPAAEWTHHCHIYMALWYLSKMPLAKASFQIKEGIRQYNVSQGGENTETSGYHETISEFYIRILQYYIEQTDFAAADRHWIKLKDQPFMDKDFPFRFYSKDHLMNPEARAFWQVPDLLPITAYENTLQA